VAPDVRDGEAPFDLVDIMLAEIEDAIMDGLGMT
jgi:hypothetical protein